MIAFLSLAAAALLDGVWKGLLLAAVVALLLRLTRERAASARYAVWWVALLAAALLPALSLLPAPQPEPAEAAPAWAGAGGVEAASPAVIPATPTASGPSAAPQAGLSAAVSPSADAQSATTRSAGSRRAIALPAVPSLRIDATPAAAGVVLLLLVATLAWLLRFALGIRGVRRLKRNATPLAGYLAADVARCLARAELRREVRFGVTRELATPVAAGFLRPMVLIPESLLVELSREDVAGIVLHELGHLRRRDDWAILAQRLLEAVFCWHPAVRWIGRRLDLEREIACDAWVARVTGDGRRYAGSLVRLARLAVPAPAVPAPGAASSRGQLASRVAALLSGDGRPGSHARRVALVALVAATPLLLARLGPVVAAAAPAEEGGAQGRTQPAELRTAAGVTRGELGARLDAVLARYAGYGFSGVVLVARGDRVLLEKGYGLADVRRGIPMTADTRFRAAGMTKLLTAAAVLRLEEEGRLRVQDRVGDHLGAFPGAKRDATLHHLLLHSAGLARFGADVQRADRDAFVQAMRDAPLESVPGEDFRYSDAGYSLLGAVVERAAGEPFERYAERAFLRPAGMRASGWEPQYAAADPRLATEYAGAPDALAPAGVRPYVWGRRGSLGLVSTVGDLFRLHRALQSGAVVSPAVRDRMLAVHHGTGERGDGYGWTRVATPRGTAQWRRVAGTPGMEGELLWFPEEDLTLVIYTNGRVGWRYAAWRAAEAIALGASIAAPPPAVAAADGGELRGYAGDYLLPNGRRLTVSMRGGRLAIGASGARLPPGPWTGEDGRPLALPVRPIAGGAFAAVHPAGAWATLRFRADARGAVRGLTIDSPEGRAFAPRAPPT
ncbi:MAG TPA: serine hydrolase [Longimicrobiaceae bacterium]|nr:serine hydrolase [Longimicrobiaceae bacterium]